MKQCNNCREWIHKNFQYCPMCGEEQSKNSTQSNGSGLLIAIIILLVFVIVGGIGFYMYKGGAFNSFLNNQNDTVEMVADTTDIEFLQDFPPELYLTSATFLNNQTVKLELKIKSNGNVTGSFWKEGKTESRNLKGNGNKNDGVITIKDERNAINLILTPTIDNAGCYDCSWEYKGKSGVTYFYPTDMPKEEVKRKTDAPSSSSRNINITDTAKAPSEITPRDSAKKSITLKASDSESNKIPEQEIKTEL